MNIPRYQNAIAVPNKDNLVIDRKDGRVVAMFVEEFKKESRLFCKEINVRQNQDEITEAQVAVTTEEDNDQESQDNPG